MKLMSHPYFSTRRAVSSESRREVPARFVQLSYSLSL